MIRWITDKLLKVFYRQVENENMRIFIYYYHFNKDE